MVQTARFMMCGAQLGRHQMMADYNIEMRCNDRSIRSVSVSDGSETNAVSATCADRHAAMAKKGVQTRQHYSDDERAWRLRAGDTRLGRNEGVMEELK
jgi:hypothetical protein